MVASSEGEGDHSLHQWERNRLTGGWNQTVEGGNHLNLRNSLLHYSHIFLFRSYHFSILIYLYIVKLLLSIQLFFPVKIMSLNSHFSLGLKN